MVYQCKRRCPHDNKIKDQWDKDTEYGTDVVNDSVALISKENNDGVQQADEGEWGEYRQKLLGEKVLSCKQNESISSDYARKEGYSEVLCFPH
jgi:hypothetical protein